MIKFFSTLLLLAALAAPNIGMSQDFSNRGKDFWIAYAGHVDTTSSVMGLYLTSDVSTSGNVQVGTINIPFTITANQVTKLFIGPGPNGDAPNTFVHNKQSDAINPKAGIHVTSLKNIVVYAHIIRQQRSGATLVLPTPVLGKEYVIPSYQNLGSQTGSDFGYGQITIVAVQPNTTVEIVPKVIDKDGTHPANVPFQVTLNNVGDVYQLRSQRNRDFSGSTVKSVSLAGEGCKPIAVFSSTTWSAFDCNGSNGGDNLYQQLFPVKSWGKKFITAPFINKPYDIIRVFVTDPSTVVTKTESGTTTTLTNLISGSYYEHKTNNPTVIEASKPVSVVQYITSQTCGGGESDPEMILINPVEQTLKNITLFSAHKDYVPVNQTVVNSHYINIVIPTQFKNTLRIDNNPPASAFIDIPGSGYSYVQENVTVSSGRNPVHTVRADTGFTAIVYGFGSLESYGYNAGTNLKDLNQFVSVNNQYATVDFPAACKNAPFQISLTLPYQPTKIDWDFNGLYPAASLVSPTFTSTSVVNGITLYKYTLSQTLTGPPAAGTYPIRITVQNPTGDGCDGIQEIEHDLEIYEPPVADFAVTTNGCLSEAVLFADQSTNPSGRPIIHRHWKFDDGNSANDVTNVTHTYTNAGTYRVKYTLITDIGCKADSAEEVVVLSTPPVAGFAPAAPYCAGKNITFNNTSVGANIATWTWNFGDGSPAVIATTGASQPHRYTNSGPYTVTLKVETVSGCMSPVLSQDIVVNTNPVAKFDPPFICINDVLAPFNDGSSVTSGSVTGWEWNFGDDNSSPDNPNTSAAQNATHHYTAPGNYTAQLIAVSNTGCRDTVQKTVQVNGVEIDPRFSLENMAPDMFCSNKTITIKDNSTVDAGKIIKIEILWDAMNPNITTLDTDPAIGKIYTHNYQPFSMPNIQNVTVLYKVYTGITCVNMYIWDFNLKAVPLIPDEIPLPVCSNADPFQVPVPRLPIQGEGAYSGSFITPGGLFDPKASGPGSHIVTFTYNATNGCSASLDKTVFINPTPKADAGPDKVVLEGGKVTLSPIIINNIPVTYTWLPGDYLSNPNIAQPEVTSPPNDYRYKLTVRSDMGCESNDEVIVTLLKNPIIPNIFTPNGDGIHDRWEIAYLESYPGCVVQIYNRYGQMVHRIINYSTPWDGRINGKDAPVGTYYYIIDPKNGRKPITGFVDIIR
jgi:gliding motility-associated-like protein